MKKYSILSLLVIQSFTLYSMTTSWDKSILKMLPAPLAKIELHKSTKGEAEKLLGVPALEENGKSYYEKDGFKYVLEVVYKKNVVQEFTYTFTGNRPSAAKLPVDTKAMSSDGKYFKYADAKGEVLVDPTSKTIYSVRLK